MPSSRQVQEKVAHSSCNPARFSKLFSSPPSTAGSSQWERGAFRPQPIRRQQAVPVKASNTLSPTPCGPWWGGNLWSVSGATCVRWDWLASQSEGSRLASEDGAIPRACGLASARQSSLKPEGLPLGLDQSQCALASEK